MSILLLGAIIKDTKLCIELIDIKSGDIIGEYNINQLVNKFKYYCVEKINVQYHNKRVLQVYINFYYN